MASLGARGLLGRWEAGDLSRAPWLQTTCLPHDLSQATSLPRHQMPAANPTFPTARSSPGLQSQALPRTWSGHDVARAVTLLTYVLAAPLPTLFEGLAEWPLCWHHPPTNYGPLTSAPPASP